MERIKSVKKAFLTMLVMMLGYSLSVGVVYAESDEYGEVYTKRTFEEVNKDKGYKEGEDFEYIYIEEEEIIGIKYHEEEVEFAISEGLAVTEVQGKEEYQEVVSKLEGVEDSEKEEEEQPYFNKTRVLYASYSFFAIVVLIILGSIILGEF